MEIKFLTQPKEVKLGELLQKRLQEGFHEVHFIAGMVKDSGIEELLDALKIACEHGTLVNFYLGIDRKNTSKDMLSKLLPLGAKLNIHINSDDNKVETRIYLFEKKNGDSYLYLTGGKLSTSGLLESIVTITEIKYNCTDSADKTAFSSAKSSILNGTLPHFQSADLEEIILLAEKGEISARITERKIPNIAEMYGITGTGMIGEQVYDESASTSTIKLDELADIDIDFDPGISVRKNVQLEAEKEAKREQKEKEDMLKNLKKSATDLDKFFDDKFKDAEISKKPTIHLTDAIDYENMTTLMIETGKIAEKGPDANAFKIPKALADNLNTFFDGMVKTSELTLKIMDNASDSAQLLEDQEVEFHHSDKGIFIKSRVLNELKPLEGDILRIIKEDEYQFRCEIIRQNTAEYEIWNCYCTNVLKGSKRRFGVI